VLLRLEGAAVIHGVLVEDAGPSARVWAAASRDVAARGDCEEDD